LTTKEHREAEEETCLKLTSIYKLLSKEARIIEEIFAEDGHDL